MTCEGCGNPEAYSTFSAWVPDGGHKVKVEFCDRCGARGTIAIPDVFWDGKPEHGLADDPRTGKPRVFGSKREKADYLRRRGLRESSKVGGAYQVPGPTRPPERNRDLAMKALKTVRELGRDVRRQAYLKLQKDGKSFSPERV